MFAPAALVTLGVVVLLYRAQEAASRAIAITAQEKVVEIGAQRIAATLETVISDIRVLAGQQQLRAFLATGAPGLRDEFASEYLNLAAHKRLYAKIRVLDPEGQEVVRVDWADGTPRIVPERALQDRAASYYVEETLDLGPGEIYLSPMDLDMEHGRIEEPVEPTIRFGMVIVDAAGRKQGLIVLDYRARRMLDRVRSLAVDGSSAFWIVNADGYWLLGPDPDDEWAFMYPERRDRSFARAHPEAWERIRGSAGLGHMESAGGMLTYERVLLGQGGEEGGEAAGVKTPRPLYLMTYLPSPALAQLPSPVLRNWTIATGLLMALLAFGSWLVARHWTMRVATEEAVRRSEMRFRSLFESAPDAVVITDAGGRIVLANAQTERLFGYGRQELQDQPIEMLVPERFRREHVRHRASYVAEPRARPMGIGLELYGRRRDGSEMPVAVSLSPTETAEGVLVFCDIRDVTEQRAAEQQIQDMNVRLTRDNAELELLNKELEAFSYSVSHDLRAPLRAIDGFSQALLEDCADQLDAVGRGHLGRIRAAAQRMGLLIDDLLKLARVTRAEVSFEEVDLGRLAADILADMQAAEPGRRAQIRIADGLRVEGDPRLLRIALENLLSNAWKFTGKQNETRIEVGRAEMNGTPTFFVRDNGVGFDMAHSARLFGAFQRLHQEREFTGTGIGLATAQRIVRRHGGRIWVEAAPGQGATFYFTMGAGEHA
ncbi:MAG: hypothetical protein BroJett029_08220 [Alphaproteobacteria bacterium]|nr:MAG: hypothetical protein BroJett029_08220 [Alphaproteobacteria bacterium]